MEIVKIDITDNAARVTAKPGCITAGTVGLPIEFTFDYYWSGLNKIAVFRCGDVVKDRRIVDGVQMTIPHEVLAKPCGRLVVGVEGRNNDGTIVIPTTYANVCTIVAGTNASDDPAADPTPTMYDEIMTAIKTGRPRDINSGALTARERAAFATVNGSGFLEDPSFLYSNSLNGFATWVYGQVGVGIAGYLKSVHNTFTSMFNPKKDEDGFRYKLMTEEEGADPYALAMLLEGSYSGGKNMQHHGYKYTLELSDYKIGDIFCMRYADTLDGVYGDSCYYMALYKAENTFILYQDFGPHEQSTNPSNAKVIDYAGLMDIVSNTECIYYYVLRPENIALMPMMEAQQRQARENAALRKEIAEGDQKQSEKTEALSVRLNDLAGKLRDMNVGKLTAAEKAVLGGLIGSNEPNKGNLKSMAEWTYGEAGIDVTPYITGSISDVYWHLFPSRGVLRTEPSDYLTMLVPESYGGTDFTKYGRTSYSLSMDKYQVGDLFCGKYPTSGYWVAVYLGENRFLVRTGANGAASSVYTFDETNTIYTVQAWLYYFVLRPENIAIADVINLEAGTGATLKGMGVTATAQELNHMAGVTAGVQKQLDGKVPVGLVTRSITVNDTSATLDEQIDAIYASMAATSNEVVSLQQSASTDLGSGSNWMLLVSKTNDNYGAIIAWQYGYPAVIKTRGRSAGNWGGWNQVTTSGTILTSDNWKQYITTSGGGTAGIDREYSSELTNSLNSTPIPTEGTHEYSVPGTASRFYIVTVKDPDFANVYSITVDYRSVSMLNADSSGNRSRSFTITRFSGGSDNLITLTVTVKSDRVAFSCASAPIMHISSYA